MNPLVSKIAHAMYIDWYHGTMGASLSSAEERWQNLSEKSRQPWYRRAQVALKTIKEHSE